MATMLIGDDTRSQHCQLYATGTGLSAECASAGSGLISPTLRALCRPLHPCPLQSSTDDRRNIGVYICNTSSLQQHTSSMSDILHVFFNPETQHTHSLGLVSQE
jgi:hypothetical protein